MKFEDLNLENVNNITEGMVFKNRRDLFDYLGVEYTVKGKRAKLQTNKIDLIFAYRREGHKIIVEKAKPLANIELSFKLINNRQRQISQLLILDLITSRISNEDDALVINQNVLIPYLALANQNYIYYYYNKNNELAKKLGVEIDEIKTLDNWLKSVRSSLKSSIDSAINELEKEGLILHNKVYKVQVISQESSIHVVDKINQFGDKVTEYETHNSEIQDGIRLATNSETNHILRIEQDVLTEMGMTKKDLLLQGKYSDFNKRCRNKTIEYMGVGFYFLCHKFNYADGFIEKKKLEVLEQLKQEDLEELKYELNSIMCERVRVNSKKRIDKHNIALQEGKDFDEDMETFFKYDLDNKDDSRKVAKLLMSYERELGREYIGTQEHKEIEERLLQFLLLIKDLEQDTKDVWCDTVKSED